jgi:steroid delta-isomerase-like uncharacterized protein
MISYGVLNRYLAGWNGEGPAAVAACFGDDGTYEDPATGAPLRGKAIAEYAQACFDGFADMRFEVPNVVDAGGGRVAFQWVMHATHAGTFAGMPATNRAVTLPGADFVVLDGNRIASLRGYFDLQSFVQQLQGG